MPRRKLLEEPTRRQVQEALRVGPHHLYVLGRLDIQVNVYAQQVRAINLLHAVADCEDLSLENSRVAVVGGGVAGLTAAATAAWLGFRDVTLLEKETELLSVFDKNSVRYLHPHMYEWPEASWRRCRAGVPILDWEAGKPEEVARQIKESWETLRETFAIKRPPFGESRVVGVKRPTNFTEPLGLRFSSGRTQSYDVVILAVGFGPERNLNGETGYWHNDNHEFIQGDSEGPVYVVSGCGDGGLIDYLRMRLRNFSQGDLVTRFLPDDDPEVEVAKAALLDIERELWEVRQPHQDQAEAEGTSGDQAKLETQRWLFGKYWAIDAVGIRKRIAKDLRPGRFAYLESTERSPLRPAAFILNRFLALQVLRADGLAVDASTGLPLAFVHGKLSRWPLRPVDGVGFPAIKETINRHGPRSQLAEQFPEISAELSRQSLPRHNDATRRPGWPKGEDSDEASLRSDLTQAIVADGDLLELLSRLVRCCEDNSGRWRSEDEHTFGNNQLFIESRTALEDRFKDLDDVPTQQDRRDLIRLLSDLWGEFGSALAVAHLATMAFQEALRVRLLMLFRDRIERAGGAGLRGAAGSLVPAHAPSGVDDEPTPAGKPRLRAVARLPSQDDYEVQFVWHSDLPVVRSFKEVGVIVPNADDRHLRIGETEFGWTAELVDQDSQLRTVVELLELDAATIALVMPELSSSPSVVEGLEAWLRERGRPLIIAAGSYHTHAAPASPAGHQAMLLIASASRVVRYPYPKSTPCHLAGGRLEGISRDRPRLTLHLSFTSSLACVVCADLNNLRVRELIEALRPRLILVPACLDSRLNEAGHGFARSLGSIVAIGYAPLPAGDGAAGAAAYVAGAPVGVTGEALGNNLLAPRIFVP